MNNLSKTELEIMRCIWSFNRPVCNRDILEVMNSKYNKQWKIQTLSTYLQKLVLKNYIKPNGEKLVRGNNYHYVPVISAEEYRRSQVYELVNDWDSDIVYDFVSAFSKDKSLSKEDMEELKKLIDGLD
ncbi:MAG: BlaI/MecI/CopY family transcriptional regulator [Clostridiales bacterium]|nr:BlaI/MecI/CopY family transcriptional regulator [Clostridiales bacterium]MDY3745371.1 BlaI/MecI/CopY family transcriptional regulator [Lachnospiraceae bacterium]